VCFQVHILSGAIASRTCTGYVECRQAGSATGREHKGQREHGPPCLTPPFAFQLFTVDTVEKD
jgi:hypothetical protein